MVISKITSGALLAMALASCAVPKATAVAQPPAPKKAEPEAAVVEAPVPVLPGDEIRMPADMVGLPTDLDFRATTPVAPKSDPAAGSVFVRPPTDPPSRVKPKPTE